LKKGEKEWTKRGALKKENMGNRLRKKNFKDIRGSLFLRKQLVLKGFFLF